MNVKFSFSLSNQVHMPFEGAKYPRADAGLGVQSLLAAELRHECQSGLWGQTQHQDAARRAEIRPSLFSVLCSPCPGSPGQAACSIPVSHFGDDTEFGESCRTAPCELLCRSLSGRHDLGGSYETCIWCLRLYRGAHIAGRLSRDELAIRS